MASSESADTLISSAQHLVETNKGQTSRQRDEAVVDVCGKRVLEYVLDALAKYNRGASSIRIRATAGNISKGVGVSRILADHFSFKTESTALYDTELDGQKTSCLEIQVARAGDISSGASDVPMSEGFVEFPACHLLLDLLLWKSGPLRLFKTENESQALVTITPDRWNFRCAVTDAASVMRDGGRKSLAARLTDAYYRSGLLLSPYWEQVGRSLSQFDDVILGVDTNILLGASLSEQLINSVFLIDPRDYIHTPNWVLVVIPNAVIHELEQFANCRDSKGFLLDDGRLAFRALQEILELNDSADLSGISLVVVGDADPALDARIELRALRQDFVLRREQDLAAAAKAVRGIGGDEAKHGAGRLEWSHMSGKGASGDMIIRAQYKQFLRQIDFHKGVFFLTADKSCAALARAEGLHSIYYKKPESKEVLVERRSPSIPGKKNSVDIRLTVPIGKLIYELAVEFGTIRIEWSGGSVELQCDLRGESLDRWVRRQLKVVNRDAFAALAKNYHGSGGRINLSQVNDSWRRISDQLLGGEAL
jgi:DNA-binding protein